MGPSSINIFFKDIIISNTPIQTKKGGTTLTLEHVNSIKKQDHSWEKTPLVMKLKSTAEKKSDNQKMPVLLFKIFHSYY